LDPDATIVIPQHERADLTVAVVRALRTYEPVRWPIIVVDDGSRSSAAELVEQRCHDVRLLRQPHLGVTAAWNSGLQAVATPLVVLLNNDVTVGGRWVDPLLRPLRLGTAIVSGAEARIENSVPAAVLARLARREFIAGWCWAFRAGDVQMLGGFDGTLRMYFSDTDLQARLLGLEAAMDAPTVVRGLPLRHVGHGSTRFLSERRAIWTSDRARFIRKWMRSRP